MRDQDSSPVDPEALEAQSARLRRLARGLVRDYDRAEDVVQETCLKALAGGVKPRRSVGACLAGVARNVAWKLRRGDARRGARERRAARPEGVPSTAQLVERLDEQRRVLACVHALDEPYRRTLLLRYFEDLSPTEIARSTGIPVETVKTRLKRGLERLRKQMDRTHGGDRRAWLSVLMPVAGLQPLTAASAATTPGLAKGGAIVSQGAGMKITAGIVVVVLLVGGGLLAAGAFDAGPDEDAEKAPALLTTDQGGPELSGAKKKSADAADDEASGSGAGAPGDAGATTPEEGAESSTKKEAATAAKPGAKGDPFAGVKPAVRRSPYGPPKRRGTRMGPGAGGWGGPTGHWTRFGMFPPAKGTARLAVTLLDEEGTPVPGADVYLGPPDEAGVNGISFGDLRRAGKTDAKGRLLAEALPDGAAALFGNYMRRLNGRFGLDGRHGTRILLEPGKTTTASLTLPLTVGNHGSVKGQVRGPDGRPLRSASVGVGFQQVWTKADGRFSFEGVGEGKAQLFVRSTGHGSQSIELDVKAGQTVTRDVNLEFEEKGTVRVEGAVVGPQDEPVANAYVYLMIEKDRTTNRTVVTDAAGRFVLEDLPERVRSDALRLQASRVPEYESKVITYKAGIRDERVTLKLPVRYVRFELRVLDAESGEPIRQVKVAAERPESRRTKVTLSHDYDKGYRKGMVEAGRHKVTIDALDHEDTELEVDVRPDAEWRFTHTVKLARINPPSVQINLTVELTDVSTGAAIERAKIEVQDKDTQEALTRFAGRREGGLFLLPALSGTRRLVVTAKGFEPYAAEHAFDGAAGAAEVKIQLRPK